MEFLSVIQRLPHQNRDSEMPTLPNPPQPCPASLPSYWVRRLVVSWRCHGDKLCDDGTGGISWVLWIIGTKELEEWLKEAKFGLTSASQVIFVWLSKQSYMFFVQLVHCHHGFYDKTLWFTKNLSLKKVAYEAGMFPRFLSSKKVTWQHVGTV